MRNLFITIGGIAFIGICSALAGLWSGMLYFALVGIMALTIYWAVILIIGYKHQFFDEFDAKFKYYIARLINSTDLTTEEVVKNQAVYVKKFKKTLIYEKIKQITLISVLIVIAIICFSLMVSGKI